MIPTPDRDEAQRRREGSKEGVDVATRDVQKAQDKDDEEKKVICLDFGADRHRAWKEHGALFCDQFDKYDNIAPEKKNSKRRRHNQYWCTVTGHINGFPVKCIGNWFVSRYQLQMLVPPVLPTDNNLDMPLVNQSLANDGVAASPIPFSPHVPRELLTRRHRQQQTHHHYRLLRHPLYHRIVPGRKS
jgi:hypothetical protein